MRRILAWGMIFLFVGLLSQPIYANSELNRSLNISTMPNRPLSIDRLLYTAFKGIDYKASFSADTLQTGYSMANNAERDGVIASTPDFEKSYPNLRRVPVAVDRNNVLAFAREDSNLKITGWDDLAGQRVGLLTQRVYIEDRVSTFAELTIKKETVGQLQRSLINHECDLIILAYREHETIVLPDGIIQVGQTDVLPEYLYLHKSYENLIPVLANALEKLFEDGIGEKMLNDIAIPEMYPKKTILRIFSSNEDVMREDQFNTKLREQFLGDETIEWYTIALNSKRFSDDSSRLVYFANLLRRDSVSRNISAIIVSGDSALEFLKEHYYLFFRNVPVLIYSTGDYYEPMIYGYEQYFTGVVGGLSTYETVSTALELFPDTQKIYVVNDYSQEGEIYRTTMSSHLQPFADRVELEYNENIDRDSLLAQLRSLPENSLILMGSYFCDSNGQYYPQSEMKRALEENCNAPIFELYSTTLEYDSIGGKCLDYEKYGEVISGMINRLLSGETNIPLDTTSYNRWVFNKVMLERYRISERSLPPGAEIINKRLSVWETNPQFVAAMIALLISGVLVIIGLLIFMYRYRKQNLSLLEARKHLHTAEEMLAKDIKLREVNERLEKIINTSPIACAMVVDYKAFSVNIHMTQHIGLKPGDDIRQYYIDPRQFEDMSARSAEYGAVRNELIGLKMPDGNVHRFLSNISTVEYESHTVFIVWAVDIEENETQKDMLKTSQDSLQTVLDSLPVAVRILDVDTGAIMYANNECLNMFEFDSFEQASQSTIYAMIPEFQSNGVNSKEQMDIMLREYDAMTMEFEYLSFKGKLIDTQIITCKIRYNDRLSSVAILKDLKEEKEYKRRLLSAAEKEKEANQLKSRFLAQMSHEIRTPMNAIIGLCEIELRKPLPDKTLDIYNKIHTSAQNLLQIINDILDLSKIEADKMQLIIEEFDLEEVLSGALFMAAPRLEGKDVELLLKADFDLPRYIIGDRTRLWQILKNFLDNSAKYTDNGKIIMEVSADHTRTDHDTVYLSFVIKDTGIGMSEDQLQKLFTPYEQFYSEAQRKYSGTGLGMPISGLLCKLMGGELHVVSNPGIGTTISLTIPFARGEEKEQNQQSQILAGTNILAVDDDSISLNVMSELLNNNNANCVTASSGEEAIEIILEHREKGMTFDAILLDYMLEDMDGLATAEKIQTSLSKAPKLLMVTSYQKELLCSDIEKLGICGIIEKPFVPSHFIGKLGAALGYTVDVEPEEKLTTFKDVRVLVCEDNHLNQEVATGMLSYFGIETVVADNGSRALDILNSGPPVNLILMDLQMPVMDGYEAARAIRTNPRFDYIPIISLSADAMPDIIEKCLQCGMNDHAAKPIGFERLHSIFLKWLPEDKRSGEYKSRPGLEINDMLERFGGNKAQYEKSLLEFANGLPDEWPAFDHALENMKDTLREIHNLKGVSGNLSESEIYKCTLKLENSLRSSKPEEKLYTRLIEACERAKHRILSGAAESEAAAVERGATDELTAHLDELRAALNDYDPISSTETVERMKRKLWPSAADKLEQLYALALNYEFDDALALLETIGSDVDEHHTAG